MDDDACNRFLSAISPYRKNLGHGQNDATGNGRQEPLLLTVLRYVPDRTPFNYG